MLSKLNRGDTIAAKKFLKKLASDSRSLGTNKKLLRRKEEVSIFKDVPKQKGNKTADWGLCKNIFERLKIFSLVQNRRNGKFRV